MIDSTRLASFVAFAEELNFTRAAARLHISQPALHVQIKKLADDLAVPLYVRKGRALALTPQGRELLGFGREVRERTGSFLSSLQGVADEQVVLAAGEGALLYALGPAIRKTVQRPGVKLRVLTRDRDGTIAALTTAEAHLGVTTLEVVPDALEATLVRRASMMAVMPRGHPLGVRRRIKLTDLRGQRLILPPPDRPHRQAVARALASAGVTWELALEAGGWEVMLHYAGLGVGVAIVNDLCRIPRNAVARPVPELPALNYHLLHGRRIPLPPPALLLRAAIIESFAS